MTPKFVLTEEVKVHTYDQVVLGKVITVIKIESETGTKIRYHVDTCFGVIESWEDTLVKAQSLPLS